MDLREIKKADLREYARTKYGIECNSKGMAHCPFHPPDKTPSLSFYQWKGGSERFKCFHEDSKAGTIIDFVMALEGKTRKEACSQLLKEFEGPLEKVDPKNLVPAVKKEAAPGVEKKAAAPKEEKKAKHTLYYDYKNEAGKILYRKVKVIFEDGSRQFFFQHPIAEKPGLWDYQKGKADFIPYCLDRFKGNTEVIICEGEKDADTITRLKAGFLATSAPTGKGSWPDVLNLHFKDFKKATFIYDVGAEKDARGHAEKLQAAHLKLEIFIVKVPMKKEGADITDYLLTMKDPKQKQMALLDLLEKSERFTIDLKEIEKAQKREKFLSSLSQEIEAQKQGGKKGDLRKIKRLVSKIGALEEKELITTKISDVKRRPVEWLWEGRIPKGMMTLVAGHPGVGKSFFIAWLLANLSQGEALPDERSWFEGGKPRPYSSLLIAGEDDPNCVIRPRLEGCKADLSKIEILNNPLDFALDDLGGLEKILDDRPGLCVIVIDPLNAFLGGKVDYFRDPDIRRRLAPMIELAKSRGLAVIGVVHFNKSEDAELITRIGGSMAFSGVARSTLGISFDMRDSADPDSQDVRLLGVLKMNLRRKPDTLAFKITDDYSILFEKETIPIDPVTMFSKEQREKKQRWLYAEQWLLDNLEERGKPAADLIAAAAEDNVPRMTLYRARNKLIEKGFMDVATDGFGKEKKSLWMLKSK